MSQSNNFEDEDINTKKYAEERIVGRTQIAGRTHYVSIGTYIHVKTTRCKQRSTYQITSLQDVGGGAWQTDIIRTRAGKRIIFEALSASVLHQIKTRTAKAPALENKKALCHQHQNEFGEANDTTTIQLKYDETTPIYGLSRTKQQREMTEVE